MKIVLVAPLFYPDVGGPSIHVRKIADFLSQRGHQVTVIAYGKNSDATDLGYTIIRIPRSYPSPIRWFLYLLRTLQASFNADVIYTFDLTAAGLPAAVSSWIFRKPLFLRIGGDPIWERSVEHRKRFITLSEYYRQGLYKVDAPHIYSLIRWIVSRADRIVTYNQSFQDFYCTYFGADRSYMRIIKNPVFIREHAHMIPVPTDPVVLFAGRFVSYKNLECVIRAIKEINAIRPVRLLLIGHGPDERILKQLVSDLELTDKVEFRPSVAQTELFEQIKQSTVALGPAISEFNPNFILESLSFGKPVLLAQDNGLSVQLPPEMLFDPLNQKDLQDKLMHLLSPQGYAQALSDVAKLDLDWSWDDVLGCHEDMIKDYFQKQS